MSKHTPGPLTAGGTPTVDPPDPKRFIFDSHGYIIGHAYATAGHVSIPEQEANARLWAASPELLAAAVRASQAMLASRDYDTVTWAQIINALNGAIAKAAEGGAP